MKIKLARAAFRDLREHGYFMAADDPLGADREMNGILDAIVRFSDMPADGPPASIRGLSRPVHKWYLHPFHVYYERRPHLFYVVRIYHYARRPIERR